MKLTRKLIAAMLSVCMALTLLTSAASAASITASYGAASYYDIAVTAYSRMLAFQNGGVVPAANQAKKYGLIDPTGKVILPFQYAYVWALDGGLFGVAKTEGEYGRLTGLGVVNAKGKTVLAPSDDCVEIGCRNGIVCVGTRTEGTSSSWGGYDYKYYTTDWKPSTEEAYRGGSSASSAHEWKYRAGDYYVVSKYVESDTGWGWKYLVGLQDSDGKAVIPMGTYDEISAVVEGGKTVFIMSKDEQCSMLDASLKAVVAPGTYDDISVHWNGGAALEVRKGEQTGAIGFDGKVLVPLGSYEYDGIGGLNEDGYITAISPDGASSTLFKDGQAVKTYAGKRVTSEVYYRHLAFSTTGSEKYGMMDTNEKVIIPEQYTNIVMDGNDYLKTLTSKEDSWEYIYGLYTQDGQQVFADKYSEVTHLADGSYKLNDGVHFGMSKVAGTTVTPVIPLKYLDMRVHTLQFIELYDGSKYSVVDLSNNVVVPESSEAINAFKGDAGGLRETLERVSYYAWSYDGYTESVLPFLSKTGSDWTTVYADYWTGEVQGQLDVRASNINDEGWFVYQNANGLYGFGRVEGTGFLDIIPGHWAEKAVDWAVNGEKEITNGVGNGKFSPDAQCTNAMILTFLWRAAGKPISTAQLPVDITGKKVDYAEGALRWAAEKGMISKDFDPTAACTSASAVKFIWQAFDSPTPTGSSTFTDVPAGADYAAAVAWAEQLGITQGEGNHIFSPDKVCSRGRILTFLYRAYVEDARLKS